jgi:hypothetical protein
MPSGRILYFFWGYLLRIEDTQATMEVYEMWDCSEQASFDRLGGKKVIIEAAFADEPLHDRKFAIKLMEGGDENLIERRIALLVQHSQKQISFAHQTFLFCADVFGKVPSNRRVKMIRFFQFP